jgi:hypothetical protein
MEFFRLIATLILNGRPGLSIFLTVVSLGLAFSPSAPALSPAPIDIVFDLDWTLINPTNEEMARVDDRDIIRFQNEIYRITNQAIDVLIELHQQPEVRISFFSGGSAERNQFAIKAIYEKIHARTKNNQAQPFRILSAGDLTTVSDRTDLKFTERYKKDLSRFFDLKSAVLIDDVANFTMPGQERNILWIGKTYNDRPQFEVSYVANPRDAAYLAPNQSEWLRDRNKLLPVKEALLSALKMTRQKTGSFVENLNSLKSLVKKCSAVFSG